MYTQYPRYEPLQGKRLENLKIILSCMEIGERNMKIGERNNYFAFSMPYFVLKDKDKDSDHAFNDEGTYLLIADEHKNPIAFAQPDLEDSFLEVGDNLVALNIQKQIRSARRDIHRYLLDENGYLKLCYIEAPVINISCVGVYEELSKGPAFWVDSRSGVRSRTRSTMHMVELQDKKMLAYTDKGRSVFGVPPN
jgi:hypothetical protein